MSLMSNLIAKIAGKFIANKLDLKEKNQMEDTQKWWLSRTNWQGIVLIVVNAYVGVEALAPSLGFNLPPISGIIITLLNAILGGGIVYTRNTATKKIG